MARVSLSDEQFQTLTVLAQTQGLTPEQFLAALIEQPGVLVVVPGQEGVPPAISFKGHRK